MSSSTASAFVAYAATATVTLTVITFGLACIAVPMAGPYCPYETDCITYPFTPKIQDQFPHDYLWMFVAIPQTMMYLIMIASIQSWAPPEKVVFGTISLVFATICTSILVSDYYIQLNVIQPSVLSGEAATINGGLELLTMFNGHGVFIALEEIAFLCMSISLVFLAPLFHGILRGLLALTFVSTMAALVHILTRHGWNKSYRFEVYVIAIDWLSLILCGTLIARLFWLEGAMKQKQL